jgi:hypothetical protein
LVGIAYFPFFLAAFFAAGFFFFSALGARLVFASRFGFVALADARRPCDV